MSCTMTTSHKQPHFSTTVLPFLLTFLICLSASAQSNLKMMQYNLMYYTNNSGVSGCTPATNNLDTKDSCLRTIFHHVTPDVFCVCEVGSNETYVDRILNNVININGIDRYRRGPLTHYSGGTIANMIYYDSEKLTLCDSYYITTQYRDINGYKMHVNGSMYNGDSTFITFWIMHLKAGQYESAQTARHTQTQRLMERISSSGMPGNYIVSGDFNIYRDSEPAYQEMVNYTNSLYRLYDPIDRAGDWNNNGEFADIHTQSTHSFESSGCFSTGGLDDRFDFILVSPYVYYGSYGVQVLPETYYALGQDGEHFNNSLIQPQNNSLPQELLTALYRQSDHLPVITEFAIDETSGITEPATLCFMKAVNPVADKLTIHVQSLVEDDCTFEVFSVDGKKLGIYTAHLTEQPCRLDYPFNFPKGIYILKASGKKLPRQVLKLIKQ